MIELGPSIGGCSSRERSSRWFPTIPILLVLTSAAIALAAGPAGSASMQPGWPETTSTAISGSAVVCDLEGDGDLEVLIGSSDGTVYAWHHYGTDVSGWPQTMVGDDVSRLAVGDVDGDGDLEVVASAWEAPEQIWELWTKYVNVWHHDGSTLAGWPKSTGPVTLASDGFGSALGDLDGDGDLEIVYAAAGVGLFARHHDGTAVAGWPVLESTLFAVTGSPTMGDLDGDGDLEVLLPTGSVSGVFAFHHDGTPVAGWPVSRPYVGETILWSSAALDDLDGDGKLEVVVGSNDGNVYVWDDDGTPMAGWPQLTAALTTPWPVLGDLDGDGDPEVVAEPNDGNVYAWHHDGTAVTGWPTAPGGLVTSSPALADLDGDADLEVVVGSSNDNVYAWHHDGTAVTGWPNAAGGNALGGPALADLDGDGDLEVVVGSSDSKVYVWTCDVPTDDFFPWPMCGHDRRRTGCYRRPLIAEFNADPACGTPPLSVDFTDQSAGSPDSWSWDFGDGGVSTEQHPWRVYETVGRYTVSLVVSTWYVSDSEVKDHYIMVTFPDVPCDHWACDEVLSCADAGIVAGYGDGLYRPELVLTRDQMAAYVSRALAGGEEGVPEFAGTPTFPDVDEEHWALDYVEHAAAQNVIAGYGDGTYHPDEQVSRAQMAVYVARALVAPEGEAGLADYVPADPRDFPDVPSDHWAYTHIEYCVENGVVSGYLDGSYHPEAIVTRDQMAVYIARAFGLAG